MLILSAPAALHMRDALSPTPIAWGDAEIMTEGAWATRTVTLSVTIAPLASEAVIIYVVVIVGLISLVPIITATAPIPLSIVTEVALLAFQLSRARPPAATTPGVTVRSIMGGCDPTPIVTRSVDVPFPFVALIV